MTTIHFKLATLARRINRRLADLEPRHIMQWDYHRMNYYVYTIPSLPREGSRTFGPYYWAHLPALARHVDVLRPDERQATIFVDTDKLGTFPEVPLPRSHQFPVVSKLNMELITNLRAQGYKVVPPPDPTLDPTEPVLPCASEQKSRPPAHAVILGGAAPSDGMTYRSRRMQVPGYALHQCNTKMPESPYSGATGTVRVEKPAIVPNTPAPLYTPDGKLIDPDVNIAKFLEETEEEFMKHVDWDNGDEDGDDVAGTEDGT